MARDKEDRLPKLVIRSRQVIVDCLKEQGCNGQELFQKVTNDIGRISTRKQVKVHVKFVHVLAFIRAYKSLEREKIIVVNRPRDVPFDMASNDTTFAMANQP